ncbi:hypothetical protein AB0A69_11910 [Streptomyces sp. NPDC045431]|uniref:hypothetical protein n=1 Tax=Streptomyces sp. NPDC045431 TaxID=3155613 RepID=UPI0033C19D54
MEAFIREGRLFRVSGFNPSHRQLFLQSDAVAVERTTSRVEVSFAHVRLMFLKPYFRDGLQVRRATPAEFSELKERHGLEAEDAHWTWMLERDGGCFVVGSNPSWREAEYELMGDRRFLYDASRPWPPDFPVQSGQLD